MKGVCCERGCSEWGGERGCVVNGGVVDTPLDPEANTPW